MSVVRSAPMNLSLLFLLASHCVLYCSGAATWSASIASGFTSVDYSTLLSTTTNAPDANWAVEPPGISTSQPARILTTQSTNWPTNNDWLGNGPLSSWVAVSANDFRLGAGGPYNFTRTLHVPSAVIASTVMLTGSISCDDNCNLLFNGARIGAYYRSQYTALVPFIINLGSHIRPGSINHLRINLTDTGIYNGMRIQGTISGQLANFWSVNVASGFTSRDYSGPLSTTNAQKDVHWAVRRPTWTQTQAAEICQPGGGNFPTTGSWVANGPLSAWMAVSCTAYAPGAGGPYDFLYNFTLPEAVDPLSVTFVGAIACDDNCNVLINDKFVGPDYTNAWTAMKFFSYDYAAGWNIGALNTIRINFTDSAFSNGVRIEGTIQARYRSSSSSSSSTGRAATSAVAKPCPYWAEGNYYPKCYCPWNSLGNFPYCDCPSPYKGEVPYDCPSLYPDPKDPNWPTDTSTGAADSSSSGLSTTIIVVIVMAIVLVALLGAYGYYKYFRQPAAAGGEGGQAGNWHDKATLLPAQTGSTQLGHLNGPASRMAPPQGGLDYYMAAPANTQPTGTV